MKTADNLLLVPTDFTSVADCALDHALAVAKRVNGEVTLLHVIAKDKEREAAQAKLDKMAQDAAAKSGVTVKGVTKEGNIFDDIGGVAESLGARIIFMGTHGVKGMQHVLGSYAVKVITNSNVPFVVVQERGIGAEGYRNIVLPMDLSKDAKQNLDLTIKMAKYFGSKVYVYSQLETDEFLKKSIERNTAYARNEMKKNGIEHELHAAAEKGNFVKQMVKFSVSVYADLIAIVNSQERGVHELLSGTSERETITNEPGIPVMVVNPASVTNSKIAFFITGQ